MTNVERRAVNTVLETKTRVTMSMVLVNWAVILVTRVLHVHKVSVTKQNVDSYLSYAF